MIIELEMLHEKLTRLPGFPDELKILLEHMIISHHGQYEFGSPKLPMFPEALMLHYLDDLDSKMEAMRAQFEREADLDTPWTSYNPSLARPLLNTKKFLEKKPEPKAADPSEPGACREFRLEPVKRKAAFLRASLRNISHRRPTLMLRRRRQHRHPWMLCSVSLNCTA